MTYVDTNPAHLHWRPMREAPEGRCIMWVARYHRDGSGEVLFGTVYEYEDGERSYRPDGIHGSADVLAWMPLPNAPLGGFPWIPAEHISSTNEVGK